MQSYTIIPLADHRLLFRKQNKDFSMHVDYFNIAQSLINLGWDHAGKKAFKRANELFRRALKRWKRLYGEQDDLKVAIALVSIGDISTELDEYENAEHCLIQGLKMLDRLFPYNHIEKTKALMKIGNLYEKRSRFIDAMEYYRRGYDSAKEMIPIEHPRFIEYCGNILKLYRKMNNIDEALQFYAECFNLLQKELDAIHPNIAQIHLIMADVINEC
ncbi:unnamed protein product [Adineta ricciae]|uniref:Tetratricopeptide repeat protein n=1 Tax=Adineta ricciae TaxID=249248 RepID=A0A814WHW0_ADIRI|nr:unnamed protein product [Adineta ricciae]CAF1393324.1 unnamed protein product [Adineta ricciae]